MPPLIRVGVDLAGKPDAVRAADVAIIGPVMLAAAFWPIVLPGLLRVALAIFGGLTISYNWRRIGT